MRCHQSHNQGLRAEQKFENLVLGKGWKIRASNKQEQIKDHIDFFVIQKGKRERAFDVKAEKRVSRGDQDTQTDTVWIEFLNVRGDLGWLYGKADTIAFQRGETFVLVPRLALVDLCEQFCNLAKIVYSPYDALYKGYKRKGREDLISMITFEDVLSIHEQVWEV